MRTAPDSLILGLGANVPGPWGVPQRTIERALDELRDAGLRPIASSRVYYTSAMGPGHQPTYVNAVVAAKSHLPPFAILRLLKQIERKAGRRLVRKWGPRPLDIDILDYGGRRLGWPARRRRASLVLPHPEMHQRAFVLVPLAEASPDWCHPVFGVGARELIRRLGGKGTRGTVQALDSPLRSCEKPRK